METEFQPRAGTDSRRGRRTDLTGLRALAIVALLLTGAGIGFVPGGFVGIDVFFVISGFLVTGSLVGEWRRTGRISLLGFYARRVRRLLPTAALVLAASLMLTLFCLPRGRWAETGWDVLASGLSVLNWRLADQNAAAFVPDAATSILAHYWALGVTGQVLLVWPVLLLGIAGWAVRHRARDVRGPLLLTVGLVAVCSFAWSVQRTAGDPERAFLGTTTRLWELALGAALALLGARLTGLSHRLGTVLGWAGAAAVVGAVLVMRPGSGFPGYLALLPALGTAAIIASGAAGGRAAAGDSTAGEGSARPGTAGGGPHRILASRPLQAVGAHCYPLYLWYWPLLVAAHARFGELRPAAGAVVLGGAALLAFLTHRYVETPIRDGRRYAWSPSQVLRAGGLLPAAAVLGGLLFQLTVWPPVQPTPRSAAASASARFTPTPTPATPTAPGAAVLGRSPRDSRAGVPVDRVRSITPNPQDAAQDLPDVYRHDCFPAASGENARGCVYGDRTSTHTVVLAGDGHAASWVPALQSIAEAKRWRLVTYLNPNCPFLKLPLDARDERTVATCARWYDNVHAELIGPERPKLLLTTSSRYPMRRGGQALTGADADEALAEGMRRTWSGLTAARIPTVVLRDVPILGTNSGMCVSANPKRLTRCVTGRSAALATGAGAAQAAAVDKLDRVSLLDLNGAICPARECAPVIGGVLVYRDSQHLTATYARTLTPRLRGALDRILRSAQ
ncbi:acyltransferase [Plantactinospora sp. S1510]|uniref:Acyltransferase n=1 Tax=Plantactinospora alkalitolerans TaxID=2789879 RepID=A0ABS0H3U7_9ACTN|nr:acyltransferase family protein [Plantactinospora alkalitolerans]MBF9133131.1 acyltransferase [Plantactinospora alkalitolerans]